jgi:N-acetylglutamate synthase-like GNAT family acetyltransferase
MSAAQAIGTISAFSLADSKLPAMRAALQEVALPADDLDAPGLALFSFVRDGKTLGYGGLEVYGGDALLRSIVVDPDHRNEGVGRWIVELLLESASEMGARGSYLLTTGARKYFERFGFIMLDRRDAPASIQATRQMAGLCPASAVLMTRSCA